MTFSFIFFKKDGAFKDKSHKKFSSRLSTEVEMVDSVVCKGEFLGTKVCKRDVILWKFFDLLFKLFSTNLKSPSAKHTLVLTEQKLTAIRQRLTFCIERIEEIFLFLAKTMYEPAFLKSPERNEILISIAQLEKNIMNVK